MRGEKRWRRRFCCALSLVLVPLAVLGLWPESAPIRDAALELSAESGRRSAQEAPDWFVEEVTDVAGREELRANGDWSVVSFAEKEHEGLASALVRDLEARGWTMVAGGQEGVWTGVKEGGWCSWLALSCIKTGDAMCVVLQVGASAR